VSRWTSGSPRDPAQGSYRPNFTGPCLGPTGSEEIVVPLHPTLAADHLGGDLELVGFVNLRDLGGLPAGPGRRVRTRALLRADTPPVVDGEQLAALARDGVRLAVDLRDDDELAELPSPFAAAGWAVVRHPLFEGSAASFVAAGTDLATLYRRILDARGPTLSAVAATVASAGGGVVVHCAAGKDRTGLTVALLLSAVGVDDDLVVADYARTQQRLRGRWLADRIAVLSAYHGKDVSDQAELLAGSPPQVLAEALDHVRARWGSAAGYLLAHGLPPDALVALGAALTEPLDVRERTP
jgi:protein-tyrosine phosphatase